MRGSRPETGLERADGRDGLYPIMACLELSMPTDYAFRLAPKASRRLIKRIFVTRNAAPKKRTRFAPESPETAKLHLQENAVVERAF